MQRELLKPPPLHFLFTGQWLPVWPVSFNPGSASRRSYDVVQLQLAAQHAGGPQLQHRHLISRGSSEGTTGQSHPASGSASGMARVSHNPHPHPHLPNTTLPSNPAAFPPSPSIPSVPPMYPTSASGHCSPPPCPSQLPGSFLHSQQPSSACPTSPSSPSPAATCPEVSDCLSYLIQ